MYAQNSNEFDSIKRVAFVLRELRKWGRCRFDAEDVIDLSSPYKGTAERSSASKKPHIKMEKPDEFVRRVSSFWGVFKILTEFELSFGCGFCSARIEEVHKKRSDP